MKENVVPDEALSSIFEAVLLRFEEKRRRWVARGFAEILGRGGVVTVAEDVRAGPGNDGARRIGNSDWVAAPGRIRQAGEVEIGDRGAVGVRRGVGIARSPENYSVSMFNLRWMALSREC